MADVLPLRALRYDLGRDEALDALTAPPYDVIDPEQMPAQYPEPDGLTAEKLLDVLEAVAETSELVGLEITCFESPDDAEERQQMAERVMHVLEPLLAVVPEEAGVRG